MREILNKPLVIGGTLALPAIPILYLFRKAQNYNNAIIAKQCQHMASAKVLEELRSIARVDTGAAISFLTNAEQFKILYSKSSTYMAMIKELRISILTEVTGHKFALAYSASVLFLIFIIISALEQGDFSKNFADNLHLPESIRSHPKLTCAWLWVGATTALYAICSSSYRANIESLKHYISGVINTSALNALVELAKSDQEAATACLLNREKFFEFTQPFLNECKEKYADVVQRIYYSTIKTRMLCLIGLSVATACLYWVLSSANKEEQEIN